MPNFLRGVPTEPITLETDAGNVEVANIYGAVYQIDLYYASADGSTNAVVTAVRGSGTYDLLDATGNSEKPFFPRFTAHDPTDGSDLTATNTEVYLLAGDTLRLTVTGNGVVTAVVKLLV